ncbi:MAG: hypothetical protein HY985_10925 [Magnetospirillum sp.]|nr:hypothetical protein [Magnetospirillum sp.]
MKPARHERVPVTLGDSVGLYHGYHPSPFLLRGGGRPDRCDAAATLIQESGCSSACADGKPAGEAAYVCFLAVLLVAIVVFLQPVNRFIYFQF